MHAGCVRFSLLNHTILLVTLDSTDGCRKASFASSPERFLRWEPQDGADGRGPGLPLQGGKQELTAQVQKIRENQKSVKPKWGVISGGIFLQIVASKTTSVIKITHLLSQRTLLPAAVARPRKEWKFFSYLGKKINYSAKRLPGDLELVLNNPENIWSHLVSAARQFYKPS